MIVVNATVQSDPASIEKIKSALTAMEVASRAEEGCEDYTFSVEVSDPSIVRITERWKSKEALSAHFKEPHMATFQAVLAKNPPKGMTAHFYEAEEFEFRR